MSYELFRKQAINAARRAAMAAIKEHRLLEAGAWMGTLNNETINGSVPTAPATPVIRREFGGLAREVLNNPSVYLSDEERRLIRARSKIEAIKSIRARTGLGLKESKDLADAFEAGVSP